VHLKHPPSEPLPQQQQQQQQQPQLQQVQGVPGLLPAELGSPAPAVSLQQQQQQPAVQPSLLVGSSSSVPALAAAAVATSAGVSGTASWLAAPTAAAAALAHCAGDTACTSQEARVPLWLSPAGAAAATTAGAEPQAAPTAPAAADAAAGTYTGGSQAGFGSCLPGMLNKPPTLLLTELHEAGGVSDIALPAAAPAVAAAGEASAAEVSANYGMDRSGLSCTSSASVPEVNGLQDSAAGHSMPCRKPPSLLLPGQRMASGGACDCAAPAAVEAGPGNSCRRPSLVLSQQQQQAHAAGQDPAGRCSSCPPGSSDGSAVQIQSNSTGACVGDSTTALLTAVVGGSCQGAVLHSSLSTGIPAGGLTQPTGYNPTSRPLGLQVSQHDGLLAQHPQQQQQQQQQQQRQHNLPPCSNSGVAPCAAGGAGPAAEAVAAASAAASTLLQGSRAQPATTQLLSGRSPLYCSYSSAADVYNNADIQQLLHRVEACMGPTHSAVTAAAVAAAASAAAASDAVKYSSRPAEPAAALLSDRGHTATRVPQQQQQQQQQQQSLLSEHVEATFDSSSGSSTGGKPRLASSDGHLAPTGSSSRSISSMPKQPSILLRSAARAGEAEAEPGQLQEVLGSNPGASSPTPKSTGRRLMQRHVSWKAKVDVLLGDDAAPQGLNNPAEQEGGTSGVSVHQEHRHGQALQHLSSFTQQSDVTSKPAGEHYPAGAAYTRNSLAGAAAAASSAAACAGEVGDAVLAGRPLPDAAGSSWRPRLASSWDGAVVRPRGVAAAAAAPSATLVVPLSSAALAFAADLEHQQQQQQRSGVVAEQAGCEITLSGASGFASGQLQHIRARQSFSTGGSGQVQRFVAAAEGFKPAGFKAVATAGTADDGVSCCGSSELSAMGNPLAYADRLKQRMEQHLGGNLSSRSRSMSGSGLGPAAAAAAGAEEEARATAAAPLAGVTLLEQYLDEHQVLKQKAGKLWCLPS